MSADFARILLEHNHWATDVLLRDAAKLPTDQLHRRFEIGPGTLHDTLRHIVGALLRWVDRIGDQPLRPSIEDTDQPTDMTNLRNLLNQATAEMRDVIAAVAARDGWNEPMKFDMPDGTSYRFTRLAAFAHVMTHGVHHRAQVLNIRRQLGFPPLGLDLDPVEWECVQTGQITD